MWKGGVACLQQVERGVFIYSLFAHTNLFQVDTHISTELSRLRAAAESDWNNDWASGGVFPALTRCILPTWTILPSVFSQAHRNSDAQWDYHCDRPTGSASDWTKTVQACWRHGALSCSSHDFLLVLVDVCVIWLTLNNIFTGRFAFFPPNICCLRLAGSHYTYKIQEESFLLLTTDTVC